MLAVKKREQRHTVPCQEEVFDQRQALIERSVLLFAQRELANGVELSMPVNLVGELSAATGEGLAQIYLTPSGEIVVVEQVDAHVGTKG